MRGIKAVKESILPSKKFGQKISRKTWKNPKKTEKRL